MQLRVGTVRGGGARCDRSALRSTAIFFPFLLSSLTLICSAAVTQQCRVPQFLSRPDLFKQIYTHTDVRLGLGWASVFVAGGTGFYGYKVEFEKSKPVVWAGLLL